jgi:hypothetical protein
VVVVDRAPEDLAVLVEVEVVAPVLQALQAPEAAILEAAAVVHILPQAPQAALAWSSFAIPALFSTSLVAH